MNPAPETGLPRATAADAELLRREIAYYKARIADMRNAPENSRHREGMVWASTQLREAEQRLEALLSHTVPRQHH